MGTERGTGGRAGGKDRTGHLDRNGHSGRGVRIGALGPKRSLEEGPHKGTVEQGTEKGHWGRTGHWKKGPKKALPGSAGGAGAQTGRGDDDNNEDRDVVF